jgi:hypothetical protein
MFGNANNTMEAKGGDTILTLGGEGGMVITYKGGLGGGS